MDETLLDELYVGDFEGFVARRNALAKRLRADGDPEAAERVRGLKKPSRVAWAVNQVSAGGGKLRDELLDAGAGLRTAQEGLVAGSAGRDDLREAGGREQAAVEQALDAVRDMAAQAGAELNDAAVERARKTLHAVALDEEVRGEFEAHRLTTEHEVAGLGGLGVLPAGAAPPAARRRRLDKLKAAEAKARELEEERERAERAVETARAAAEEAKRDLEHATRSLERVAKDADAARRKADELRAESA